MKMTQELSNGGINSLRKMVKVDRRTSQVVAEYYEQSLKWKLNMVKNYLSTCMPNSLMKLQVLSFHENGSTFRA